MHIWQCGCIVALCSILLGAIVLFISVLATFIFCSALYVKYRVFYRCIAVVDFGRFAIYKIYFYICKTNE